MVSSRGIAFLLHTAPHTASWHSAMLCLIQPLPRKKNANNNHQGQSGGYPTPDTIPSTPKPSASLLTDIQQRANVTLEKALRAITDNAGQSGKLKALKVCLLAAAGHLKQAAEVTAKPTSSDHAR